MRLVGTIGLLLALAGVGISEEKKELPKISKEGRFLYADDDDWDWASPKDSKQPCRLREYGRMPWSALDWMEEGLESVKGVLVGTAPDGYLSIDQLNQIRGHDQRRVEYTRVAHEKGTLVRLLSDKEGPNVVIMMRNLCTEPLPPISKEDADAALEFVSRGGRLIVLDDHKCYQALVVPFMEKKQPEAKQNLDEKLRKKVLNQLALLDHDQFSVRAKAHEDLVAMGPGIVDVLKTVKPVSAEQGSRIDKILEKLCPPADRMNMAVADMVAKARKIHDSAELKEILRNAQQDKGHALRLSVKQ